MCAYKGKYSPRSIDPGRICALRDHLCNIALFKKCQILGVILIDNYPSLFLSPTVSHHHQQRQHSDLIKVLVESMVEKTLDDRLSPLKEKAFGKFNLRDFKALKTSAERISYARKSGLREMGEGSSRVVFAISSSKILKIATRGGNQNKQEVEAYLRYQDKSGEAFAEIYDYESKNYGWLIVEPVQAWDTSGSDERFQHGKMEEITGGITTHVLYEIAPIVRRERLTSPDEAIQAVLDGYQNRINHERRTMGLTTSHKGNSYIRQFQGYIDTMAYLKRNITPIGREMLQKFINLTNLGFTDIDRPDHWGLTARGRVVCLDYGIQDFHHLAGD